MAGSNYPSLMRQQQQPQQGGVQSLFQNVPKRRTSGLDTQKLRNSGWYPSTFQRTQDPIGTAGALEDMQQNNPDLLPLSERPSTPVGRSRNSPERIAERELRAYSRKLDQQLSPFAQSNMQQQGFSQPQQMARNSIFGAMQPANFANQGVPFAQPPIFGPSFTIYR